MDVQIKGQTAFVTAGAHGIGEAIADLLAKEGAQVVVADLDGAALREKASRWAGVVEANLATAQGVDHAVSEAQKTLGGPPDILINNLGVGDAAQFEEISDERWSNSLAVNLMGTIRVCRALLPGMAKRASGAVVNKARLLYLTKALATHYAPHVRVNVVLPGPIWSQMWTRPGGIVDQLVANYKVDKEEALKRFLQERYMPMGIGEPQDVAQAVVFLASPLAKFITGASLDIGGTLRGLI
jgi:NAD(P)-dependent dehydrogenase (short-subunit alcohol dehydrogenase family)